MRMTAYSYMAISVKANALCGLLVGGRTQWADVGGFSMVGRCMVWHKCDLITVHCGCDGLQSAPFPNLSGVMASMGKPAFRSSRPPDQYLLMS